MRRKLIILINPFSLHETFCRVLTKANIKLMAVYTQPTHAGTYFSLDTQFFVINEQLSRDLKNDAERIKQLAKDYEIIDIIPGYETDLAYAEQVAYAVQPELSNDPKDANLRYIKYDMNEALKHAGLTHIPQILIAAGESVPYEVKLNFPVIVKPSFQSAGSFGVKTCNDLAEVKSHVMTLQQGSDVFGKKFLADVIIQQKIEGTEYLADTVTWYGNHYVTGILKYTKLDTGDFPVYRSADFVSPNEASWSLYWDYIRKVLDVLKVKHGFAHTEFMVTENNQFYLMEINPRLSGLGGEINRFCKALSGYDQTDVYLELITGKKLENYVLPKKQTRKGRMIFLFSWRELEFHGFDQDFLKQLQSSQVLFRQFKPAGSLLMPPSSLLDIVLSISLIDENLDKINADTSYLQLLEQQGKLLA